MSQAGIYNRAILVATERSAYTKGLESELGKLQSVAETIPRDVPRIMAPRGDHRIPARGSTAPPGGPAPERRAAAGCPTGPLESTDCHHRSARNRKVSGRDLAPHQRRLAGKDCLICQQEQQGGRRRRIASQRPRPAPRVLLRLGANAHQAKLAEYLISVLARDRHPGRSRALSRMQDRTRRPRASIGLS